MFTDQLANWMMVGDSIIWVVWLVSQLDGQFIDKVIDEMVGRFIGWLNK